MERSLTANVLCRNVQMLVNAVLMINVKSVHRKIRDNIWTLCDDTAFVIFLMKFLGLNSSDCGLWQTYPLNYNAHPLWGMPDLFEDKAN
jgi:hypothetical protein